MRPDEVIDVHLYIKFPWDPQEKSAGIKISLREAESLMPLPKDRELPWEFDARDRAYRQAKEREAVANRIARDMVAFVHRSILQAVESRDTQNGYSPEEWAAMNEP